MKALSETCEFADKDNEIRDHFIYTCRSKALKTKLLSENDLNLEKLTEIARNMELSKIQAEEIEQKAEPKNESVNHLKKYTARYWNRSENNKKSKSKSENNCYRCGGIYSKDHKCPAIGRKCYNCGRLNHMSKVCRQKPTAQRQNRPGKTHHSYHVENETTTEHLKIVPTS